MKNRLLFACPMFITLTGCSTVVPPQPPNVEETYKEVDKFYQQISDRVKEKIVGSKAPDFIVIPAEAVWPIGTVLRPGTSFPADATACVADKNLVVSASMPNLFPDYANSYKKSLDLGIDNDLIKELADAGVSFKDDDAVTLKVAESGLELIDDSKYATLTGSSTCRSILSGKQLWIVRGYAIGKRTFSFGRTVDRTGKAQIAKIGSFKIDFGSGNSLLKVVDDQPAKFVQIISAITIEQNETKRTLPSVPKGGGRIFVQKDRQDSSGTSQNVVASLRAANFKVEDNVESIDSSKMPRLAQVRFFNENDRDLATQAAAQLKGQFPDISILKLRLPAPAGQLEVWLPRSVGG
ncbi:hypothetical protein [Massilia sp. YIM B04103]|uniref:hypothetical protein n=1 Tax=Massilia sp. YIM B04103 TaxID=2963106 RepID=UPI00210D2EA1|nr:hypothetical protein [Massilia sp. YIM B04103]